MWATAVTPGTGRLCLTVLVGCSPCGQWAGTPLSFRLPLGVALLPAKERVLCPRCAATAEPHPGSCREKGLAVEALVDDGRGRRPRAWLSACSQLTGREESPR